MRKSRALSFTRWVIVVAACSGFARADNLDFSLSGEGSTYTFSLPQQPTPDSINSGRYFELDNVLLTIDNEDELASALRFFYSSDGGGMQLVAGPISLPGAQVFTTDGSGNPSFVPGNYSLTNLQDDAPWGLAITAQSPGSPEPVPESSSLFLTLPALGAILLFGRFGERLATTRR
jgi:hypothetical protein